MKKILIIIVSIVAFISCKGTDPSSAYVYNNNPVYTKGYADFYGAYYITENGNINNTISLSLFSDSLEINDENALEGTGQYLFLEDIFVSATDTLLPIGTYTINKSGNSFTVYPGKNDTIDNEVYTVGATIAYYEKNPAKSKLKLITRGTFVVSKFEKNYSIVFQVVTDDSLQLKGSFTGEIPHYDLSIAKKNVISRNKFIFKK